MRAALALLLFAACGGRAVALEPLPTIPLSYEVNLLTSHACDFRGVVIGDGEARALDANLVVAFKYTRYESVTNGIRSVGFGAVHGKAVHCPQEIVQQLLREKRQ